MSTYQINQTRCRKGGIVLCEVKKDEEIIATGVIMYHIPKVIKRLKSGMIGIVL